MDKIYSRRRISFSKIPKLLKKDYDKKKKRIIIQFFMIIIIAFSTAYLIIKAISPIIEKNCSNIAKSIATKVANEQATIVMSKYNYEDLCDVTKDNSGNIAMISAKVIPINEIISDITIKIQEELGRTENSEFKLKLGNFTGLKIFSGRGPDINVKISTIGNLDTELRSEFISSGINQTIHKIYLQIECNVVVLTPFETKEEKITNQVLLAEAVIVGTTPSTYYNFNGADDNLALETM